jgi:hypothetical protein
MAEQRRTSSWLQISWRAQPDGSFLVRPLGASPLVFQTDAPTNERLVRFVRVYHAWQFWGLLLSGIVTLRLILNFWPDRFWWACAADLGLCYLLTIAFLWAGELVILRNAVRVPTGVWPEVTTAAQSAGWWRGVLLPLAGVFLLVAVAEGPQHLPFFPLMWIAPALTVAILVLLVRIHITDQKAIARIGGIAPVPLPVSPAIRGRRIVLGSLTAPLANPIAALLVVDHVISNGAKPLLFGTVALLLALSGGCGLLLGLYFLLTGGSGGIRWHLAAAAIAMPALSAIFYFVVYGPIAAMYELTIWLSVVSAAAITFPVATTFWLIARPERYA